MPVYAGKTSLYAISFVFATGKSVTTYGLGSRIRLEPTALAAHRAQQTEDRRVCGSKWQVPEVHCEGRLEKVDDFVFTTSIGTPLEGRNVTKAFQKILEDAGIGRHRFHDLRHTAATLLAIQGVHPKAIQGVIGWDQVSMVDRYAHFVDEMRKDAANKMDAILDPLAVNLAVKQKKSGVKPS